MPEVNITTFKKQTSFTGKRVTQIDSSEIFLFQQQNLADLLSANTGIFIKHYGPGSLSSSSIRGGNAAQTAILWNGINIQNTMLGQADLSLIPVALFNNVEIEYGGGSALWGSGAMGGSVHMQNRLTYNKGFQSDVRIQGSEIGNHALGTSLGFSNRQFSAVLKGYGINGRNNFRYNDFKSNEIKTQKNAGFYQYQLLPEFSWLINKRNSLSASAWLSKGERTFPSYNLQLTNKTLQYDGAGRYFLQWNHFRSFFQSGLKAAFIHEKLNYSDSAAGIKSLSQMHNAILEQENQWQWMKHQHLLAGFHFTGNTVNSNNYNNKQSLNRFAVFVSNTGFYFNHKLSVHNAFRAEYTSIQLTPLTWHSGISYSANKHIELKLNGGRVYRLPTLNDLFWFPGGNPNLKPEHGYTVDGSLTIRKSAGKYHLQLNGALFNRHINDWILWLPGSNGFTHPVNIQKVWSRGTESSISLTYSGKFLKSGFNFQSSYILSTIEENYLENHNTIGKQLIYTPRYLFNTNLFLSYKCFNIYIYHQYTGYRFTASDNSGWLNPFQIVSMRLLYTNQIKNTQFSTFFNVQNATNENYQIMQNRPMPLRFFEAGLNLHFSKNKINNKKTEI